MRLALIRWGLLALLLAAGILLGWRASITFEPRPVHYVPVHFRYPLSWTMDRWPNDMVRMP